MYGGIYRDKNSSDGTYVVLAVFGRVKPVE